MQVSQKIRLEVSPHDAQTLEFTQAKCRGLYNWWMMKLRHGEPWLGMLMAKKTLKESRNHDPVWKRTYKCPECGLVMDRDENSAINLLTRFFARRGSHTPSMECGVLQEDGLDVASRGLAQVG